MKRRLSLMLKEAMAPRWGAKKELITRPSPIAQKVTAPAPTPTVTAAPAGPATKTIGPAEKKTMAKSASRSILNSIVASQGHNIRGVFVEVGSQVTTEMIRISNELLNLELKKGRPLSLAEVSEYLKGL